VKREGVELLVAETNTPTGRYALVRFTGYLAGSTPANRLGTLIVPLRLVGMVALLVILTANQCIYRW